MRRLLIISLLAIAIAIGGLVSTIVMVQGANANHNTTCGHGNVQVRAFTIIADTNGFNNSRLTTGAWPVLTVHRCDKVVITVVNRDAQAHGLAITGYAPSGVIAPPQTIQTLTFLANQRGQFRIYCNIFCTVHVFMQSGLLLVK